MFSTLLDLEGHNVNLLVWQVKEDSYVYFLVIYTANKSNQ